MLNVTRKVGQRVIVIMPDGREVTIVVTQAAHGYAKLAVHAPQDVKIWREEIKP